MRHDFEALRTASVNLDRRAASDPNPRQQLLFRLASYRVKLAMATQLDWLARLRVLEGVAQIPPGSRQWLKKLPRPGMGAQEILETLPGLPEEWVSARDTHFYTRIHRILGALFSRGDRPLADVDDVLQGEIFGLYAKKKGDISDVVGVFYSVGKVLRGKILTGASALEDVSRVVVKLLQKSEVASWNKRQKAELPLDRLSDQFQDDVLDQQTTLIQWQFSDDIYRPLVEAITTPHDPLGAEIIRYMTGFWTDKNERADSKKARLKVMSAWLKHLIATGQEMSLKQLAAVTGVPLSSASAKIVEFKREFKGKFWHERRDLVEDLEQRMERPTGALQRLGSQIQDADAFLRSALLRLAAAQPQHRLAIMACCGQPEGREALMHKIDDRGAFNEDGEEDDDESGILSRYEEGESADPTENMSPEDAKEWRNQNKRNRDKFKARYERGVSADPTENMSPEDAKEWRRQNDIHRDNFKSGTGRKRASAVAETILQQLGGSRRLVTMIGARDFVAKPNGLVFKFPQGKPGSGNVVDVTLNADDTYTVTFSSIRGLNFKRLKTYDNVYSDTLGGVFERHTGLMLHL